MSFLAPLYALAALAVGLPILFHLIQRQPRGRVMFSSLMFLAPSPPRLTRRSRLNHLLLLALRAAALILLAFAFARPFLRSYSGLTVDVPARRTVVLVDTSASMRREGMAEAVAEEIDRLLDDLRPQDQIAVLRFDSAPEIILDWQQVSTIPPARRAEAVRAAVKSLAPSWNATNLGSALVAAAEAIRNAQRPDDPAAITQQVIVVSDLQQGSQLEAVQHYEWPPQVHVDLRRISSRKTTNASAQVLRSDSTITDASAPLRVRVANSADSTEREFRLAWVNAQGQRVAGREYPVQVPPGSARVVPVEHPGGSAVELRLVGDHHVFDNSVYVAPHVQHEKTVLYLGPSADAVNTNLAFYLQNAVLETSRFQYQVRAQGPDEELVLSDPADMPMVVVGAPLPRLAAESLRKYMEIGGRVLWVLPADAADANGGGALTREMFDVWSAARAVAIEEAVVDDYAMLTDIDFRHDIFRPLSDPRFNDFTNIRFWKHRTVSAADSSSWNVLARFDDDQSPAWIEERVGQGILWILAAGWHPDESHLALSTKFIPLLTGMLTAFAPETQTPVELEIGSTFTLPNNEPSTYVVLPSGTRLAANAGGSTGTAEIEIEEPGIYHLVDRGTETPVAVNLAPTESDTAPLDATSLESQGVALMRARTVGEIAAQQRHLRDIEMESQQQVWRWLLLTVLALLAAETWLAHRTAHASAVEVAV